MKTTVIGSATMQISISGGQPTSFEPQGRMLDTSIALARRGMPTAFISEAARDRVGDILVNRLKAEGIDTSGIDRYAGGHTPLNLQFEPDAAHPEPDCVHYRSYPDNHFDAVWPRISRGEVVVTGDYFAVAPRSAAFVREFIVNAKQSRALVVYAPGFRMHAGKQLTPVKPTLLDTIELADITVATLDEMKEFFGSRSLEQAYRDNISFYSPYFIGIEPGMVRFFTPAGIIDEPVKQEALTRTRKESAKIIAAVAIGLQKAGITRQMLAEGMNEDARLALLAGMDIPQIS